MAKSHESQGVAAGRGPGGRDHMDKNKKDPGLTIGKIVDGTVIAGAALGGAALTAGAVKVVSEVLPGQTVETLKELSLTHGLPAVGLLFGATMVGRQYFKDMESQVNLVFRGPFRDMRKNRKAAGRYKRAEQRNAILKYATNRLGSVSKYFERKQKEASGRKVGALRMVAAGRNIVRRMDPKFKPRVRPLPRIVGIADAERLAGRRGRKYAIEARKRAEVIRGGVEIEKGR